MLAFIQDGSETALVMRRQRDVKYVLDSTRVGSVGRYINHSCNVRCVLHTASPCLDAL